MRPHREERYSAYSGAIHGVLGGTGEVFPRRVRGALRGYPGGYSGYSGDTKCDATAQTLHRHGVLSPVHTPHTLRARLAHTHARMLCSVPWSAFAWAVVQVAGASLVQIDVVRACEAVTGVLNGGTRTVHVEVLLQCVADAKSGSDPRGVLVSTGEY